MRRSIDEHRAFATSLASPLPPVTVDVSAAHGLVAASDVAAVLAVPPFSNSAMDGFLCHREDLPGELRVVGDVPAGGQAMSCGRGEAVRVMTGAPVVDGLCVVPVELTDHQPGPGPAPAEVRIHSVPSKDHIRPLGDNVSPGAVVLSAGSVIDSGAVAALISAGLSTVRAHPRPHVAVISSGDELVPAAQVLGPGQIPDSNLPMVVALARANGAASVMSLHASDSPSEFASVLSSASSADLIVTTGGVSAGAYDVVKAVSSGGDMWFGSVTMKPGAPQGAGLWQGTPLLCLPGNPVAAFVSFHLFVAPVLRVLAGSEVSPLGIDEARIVPTRAGVPLTGGSHFAASLAGVDGLLLRDGYILPILT